jgi:hypothetical protein
MPQTIADQFGSIQMSPNLGRSLGRAQEFAREQSHRALLLEHLLLALTEDPDAMAVLRACNVDLVRLGTDVSDYLGRLPEDMRAASGVELQPDQELLRVLEAARQAGQQSRRKQIDGSIVLAAVVGDGKSPAAGLLKAHGMTFEEAIRALQKASAQLRSKQFSAASGQAAPERPEPAATEKPAAAPAAEPPPPAAQPPGPGQSVDEILAAARARIQQRSAAAASTPDPKPPAAKPAQDDQETLSLMSLSSFQAAPAPATPVLPPMLESPHNGRADAPAPGPSGPAAPPPRLAQRLQEHPPPPQPTGQSAEGLPPPPPQRAGADGAAPPRLPGWTARAPRPNLDEPPPPRRPGPANGRTPASRRPSGELHRPAARPGAPARPGQRAAAGPLVETIPRRMRVGAPAPAQVRIGREKIDGLMQLLMAGRAQYRPDAAVAHALTVRLRAPDGGFWIEAASPETQWVGTASGDQQDEPISWRWTVTPQRRGRRRLQLLVAARMIGRDGIAAEAAPPERVIDVAVSGSPTRRAARWIAWLVVLAVAAALGRFGQELWEVGPVALLNRLLGSVLGLLASSGFLGG